MIKKENNNHYDKNDNKILMKWKKKQKDVNTTFVFTIEKTLSEKYYTYILLMPLEC